MEINRFIFGETLFKRAASFLMTRLTLGEKERLDSWEISLTFDFGSLDCFGEIERVESFDTDLLFELLDLDLEVLGSFGTIGFLTIGCRGPLNSLAGTWILL